MQEVLPYNVCEMKVDYSKTVQHLMAVILIVTSIAIAIYQVFDIKDVANGTLMYIAQAFLLAGSIFGLDYYVKKLRDEYKQEKSPSGNKE